MRGAEMMDEAIEAALDAAQAGDRLRAVSNGIMREVRRAAQRVERERARRERQPITPSQPVPPVPPLPLR
jgi:hypothetical protein